MSETTSPQFERRFVPATDLEVRSGEDGPFVARGHAATYNEPYDVMDFREQIDPGAFRDQLGNPNVKALWNHDSGNVLGSVESGTLKLSSDDRGLFTETQFPESAHREREAIERGDVSKMSFGFYALEDRWERSEDGAELRTIMKAELVDVSPVAYPANPNTDIRVDTRNRPEPEAEESVLEEHDADPVAEVAEWKDRMAKAAVGR